ncbi:MAG: hypothetical protein HRT88_01585 [Lentisphaeraceae bacterium]|nr:hypothetical protein [Lentisphaeraceae bacterium]
MKTTSRKLFLSAAMPIGFISFSYLLFKFTKTKLGASSEAQVSLLALVFLVICICAIFFWLSLWVFQDSSSKKKTPVLAKKVASKKYLRHVGGLKDYFMMGCSIGNRISISHIERPVVHDRAFETFIAHIADFGIDRKLVNKMNAVEKKLRRARGDIALKRTFRQYLEHMRCLPSILRELSTDSQYTMLKLGKLLFEIPTLMCLGMEQDRLMKHARAMEATIPKAQIPQSIKEELWRYLESVRAGKDTHELISKAKKISYAINKATHCPRGSI